MLKINFTLCSFITRKAGGGCRGIVEVARELASRGHKVSITCLGVDPRIEWLPPDVTIVSPPLRRFAVHFGFGRLMTKILKSYMYSLSTRMELLLRRDVLPECDINVATDWVSAFVVFRSKNGAGFYWLEFFELFFCRDPVEAANAMESYYLPLHKFANSSWLQAKIKEETGITVPVILNAINHRIYYPRDVSRHSFLKRVICYGSHVPTKGFMDAIRAMKLVFKERKDVEWIVYGHSPSKERDQEAPYTLHRSISDDDLARLYSSADVVFCPSWYESFPAPPLEAMACGGPVVTTRYGTEDYAFHGENCLVVPPRNPPAMAEAILTLLSDETLANKLRKAGPLTARQFTWERTAEKMEKLFCKYFQIK